MENKMRSKILTVTKFEIVRQLKKPSFWIALLLMPLFLFAIIGLSALNGYNAETSIAEEWNNQDLQIAITDAAGILPETTEAEYHIVADKPAGIESVKSGNIDVYYYIPADFLESPTIELHAKSKDGAIFSNFEMPLRNLLMASTASHLSPADLAIITNAYQFNSTTYNADGEEVNLIGQALIPMAILGIFYILICVFGNRLIMAVVEEKENRISEMILTAVSAKDLIIGKIIALITLGFLQIAVFAVPIIAVLIIYRDNPTIAELLSIAEFNPFVIITNILLLLFSYFLFAGLSTFVGSLVPTAREASQYIGVVMLPLVSPLFFISDFMSASPNFIVYFFSYFPLSAPIALMLRNAFGALPPHELIIGLAELALCSVIVIYWTVKSFQKNAINFSVVKPQFGKRKSWKRR